MVDETTTVIFNRIVELSHKITEINIKIMYGLLNGPELRLIQDDKREYQKELDILNRKYIEITEEYKRSGNL